MHLIRKSTILSPLQHQRLLRDNTELSVVRVVGYILCNHFTVKMTSWGFPGPTHTGHNLGHNPGVTLQSGCTLQSGVTLQSRGTHDIADLSEMT